jgi:hypothetical protein
MTKGKPIRKGDHGVIWKSGQMGGGVVAAGEVISEPYMAKPADGPYWLGLPMVRRKSFATYL